MTDPVTEAPVDPITAAIAAAEQPLVIDQQVEQTPESGVSEELLLGKFKDVDSLASAYQNAEQRMHEATQRAKEYEALLQQHNQEPSYDPYAGSPQSAEDLIDLAYKDPTAAIGFAADNAPHLVPSILSAVRDYDPQRAEELSQQWQDYKLEMRLQQALAPVQQHAQHQAVTDAYQKAASLPGFAAVKADVAQFVKSNQHMFQEGARAEDIYRNLEVAYYAAIGRNPALLQQAAANLDQQRGAGDGANMESQSLHTGMEIRQEDPVSAMKAEMLAHNKRFRI